MSSETRGVHLRTRFETLSSKVGHRSIGRIHWKDFCNKYLSWRWRPYFPSEVGDNVPDEAFLNPKDFDMNILGATCQARCKTFYITLLFLPPVQTWDDDVTWCYSLFNLSMIFFMLLASDNEVRNNGMLISALNNFFSLYVPILLYHSSIYPVLYGKDCFHI